MRFAQQSDCASEQMPTVLLATARRWAEFQLLGGHACQGTSLALQKPLVTALTWMEIKWKLLRLKWQKA